MVVTRAENFYRGESRICQRRRSCRGEAASSVTTIVIQRSALGKNLVFISAPFFGLVVMAYSIFGSNPPTVRPRAIKSNSAELPKLTFIPARINESPNKITRGRSCCTN